MDTMVVKVNGVKYIAEQCDSGCAVYHVRYNANMMAYAHPHEFVCSIKTNLKDGEGRIKAAIKKELVKGEL